MYISLFRGFKWVVGIEEVDVLFWNAVDLTRETAGRGLKDRVVEDLPLAVTDDSPTVVWGMETQQPLLLAGDRSLPPLP